MKITTTLVTTFGMAIATGALLCARGNQSTQRADPPQVVSMATRAAVADRVFPRLMPKPNIACVWTIMLALPTRPEYQITIVQRDDDEIEVTVTTLQISERDLWRHLDALVAQGGVKASDVAGLARRVNAKRTVVADTSEVRRLITEFQSMQIPPWLGKGFCPDCASFQLWVDSTLGLVRFDMPSLKNHPLTDWVLRVDRAVTK